MPAAENLKPWSHLRWRIAILLCVITTINYIDRQALSIAAPVILEEFKLTNTDYGWITFGFLMAYAIGQMITGPLIDRYGTKKAFSVAVIAWSIAGMLHAAGRGFISFFGLRVLLGIGEAANFPAALKAIAEWFPKNERSLAVGVVTVGPGLGAVIAPPLVAYLITAFGWQAAFVITGAIGLVWVLLWHFTFYGRQDHPRLDGRELALIEAGIDAEPVNAGAATPWYLLLRHREVWGLMLARFVSDGSFYFFVFWLPTYLASERGFSIIEIGMFAWIPFLGADIGSLLGGATSKWLMAAGWSLNRARQTVIWVGALLTPMALPAVYSDSALVAILLIGGSMFAIQFKTANVFTLAADIYPARDVATVWGMHGAAGSFGAMLFTPFIGWVVDHYSYQPIFVIVSVMHIVSALLISVFIPRIRRIDR